MKIKKKNLDVFVFCMRDSDLSLADARVRDRMLKQVKVQMQTFAAEHTAILEKFAIKAPDGKFEREKEGQYRIPPDSIKEVEAEMDLLLAEEVDVEGDRAKTVEIVNATKYRPKAGEASRIDEMIASL